MDCCYDKFRNDLVNDMLIEYSIEEIKRILQHVDRICIKYDVSAKCTDIIDYNDSFDSLINMYLSNKFLEGKSKGTIAVYKGVLRRMKTYINKPINMVQSTDIRYCLYCIQRDRGIQDITLEGYRIMMVDFFRWIHSEGYIEKNPAINIEKIKCQRRSRDPLTLVELEKMRDSCQTPKEKAVLEVLYSTGCRISELIGIKISDINFETGCVEVFGKGSKYRKVFLNARSIIAIKNYLNSLDYKSEYLFPDERRSTHGKTSKWTIQQLIARIGERTDINRRVTPHILRHTMATIALTNGMEVEEISKILGHSKISTTMNYAKTNLKDIQIKHSKCIL